MTWIELVNELRKQPMWLLEQEVAIYWDDANFTMGLDGENIDYEGQELNPAWLDLMQLISPTNECEDPSLWTEDSGCHLSLTVMPRAVERPRKRFMVNVSTILGQQFDIEADDMDDAHDKARRLINDRQFFEDHVTGRWDLDSEWDMAEVTDVFDTKEGDGVPFVAPEVVDSYLGEEG